MSESSAAKPGNELLGLSQRSQAILERVKNLYPSLIDLSLGRLENLLEKLGRPQDSLPPVFHVAGTNGKGSTCAFLRAIGESASLKVHVLTSPHLIHLNERFRIAGKLVDNPTLEDALAEVEQKNAGAPITVFELLTGVGFLLFSRTKADFTIIEVGMGGTFDATNLVKPAVCLITPVSYDHQNFLGNDLAGIAAEKAGIIKKNIPVFSAPQAKEALLEIEKAAHACHAPLFLAGRDFTAKRLPEAAGWIFAKDKAESALPLPSLKGSHQIENAALACAAFQAVFPQYCPEAFKAVGNAKWPARFQKLTGSLRNALPKTWELWLDGAHNPHGAEALGKILERWRRESPVQKIYVILGLKEGKNAAEIVAPLLPWADQFWLVREEKQYLAQETGRMHQSLRENFSASSEKFSESANVKAALDQCANLQKGAESNRIVICGSLYLAGEVLRQDGFEMK